MNGDVRYYLKEDLYIEPLIHGWYAWPYLLPPVTLALNMTRRYMKTMKSFVANPALHINAVNSKKLAGANFVNCNLDQVEGVKSMISDLEENYTDYFEVSEAVKNLDKLLAVQKGMSLEEIYSKVPDALQGYVELVYDMNHNAGFRLFEGLIYSSSLYKPESQAISFGLLSLVKERSFVLSSPRVVDDDHMNIAIPFSDKKLDKIFRLREYPESKQYIYSIFEGKTLKGGLKVDDLLTSGISRKSWKKPSADLRLRYTGHAGILIESQHVVIMVDPVIASIKSDSGETQFTFADLPEKIDYVCLTHTHMDHVCIETLLQLRYKIGKVLVPKNNGGSVCDPSLKLMLFQIGFTVVEFEDMESLTIEDGEIRAVPFIGEHADLNIRSKTAWYVNMNGKKIYLAADSSNLDPALYRRMASSIGNVDILFVGMECIGAPMSWLYGALFSNSIPREINESRRFNGSDYDSAVSLIEVLQPDEVYVYALGLEPWFKYFMGLEYDEQSEQMIQSQRLLNYCDTKKIKSEILFGNCVWEF